MSIGSTISHRSLPSVSTYAQALEVVENAPIHNGVWKALNPNNKRDFSKCVRQEGSKVIFRFHQTDVVTWHGPDHIEILYYDSGSTAVFINCLTPLSAGQWRSELYVNGVKPAKGSVHFYREGSEWKPDVGDVQPVFEYRVDRKRAAEVRKIVLPVIEFRQAYRTLCPNLQVASFGEHVVMQLLESPPKDDVELIRLLPNLPADRELLDVAMAKSGAVKKVELPLGSLPKKSRWEDLRHLI